MSLVPSRTRFGSLQHSAGQLASTPSPCLSLDTNQQAEFDLHASLSKVLYMLAKKKVVKWRLLFETGARELFTTSSDSPVPQNISQGPPVQQSALMDDLVRFCAQAGVDEQDVVKVVHDDLGNALPMARQPDAEQARKKRSHSFAAGASPVKKQKPKSSVAEDNKFELDPTAKFSTLQDQFELEEGEHSGMDDDDDEYTGFVIRRTLRRVDSLGDSYEKMFKMIQQKGCKKIMQTWIKKCHPKKQARFPYNGGAEATSYIDYDERNKGRYTAPPYWLHQDDWESPKATGCRHREPDHITKRERLNMCVHILRLGRKFPEYPFDLDMLRESTQGLTEQHPSHFNDGGRELLNALYMAREQEVRFERGEIDAKTTVAVLVPVREKEKSSGAVLLPQQQQQQQQQCEMGFANSMRMDEEHADMDAEADDEECPSLSETGGSGSHCDSTSSSFHQAFANVSLVKAGLPSPESLVAAMEHDTDDERTITATSIDLDLHSGRKSSPILRGNGADLQLRSPLPIVSPGLPRPAFKASAMQRTMSERPRPAILSGLSTGPALVRSTPGSRRPSEPDCAVMPPPTAPPPSATMTHFPLSSSSTPTATSATTKPCGFAGGPPLDTTPSLLNHYGDPASPPPVTPVMTPPVVTPIHPGSLDGSPSTSPTSVTAPEHAWLLDAPAAAAAAHDAPLLSADWDSHFLMGPSTPTAGSTTSQVHGHHQRQNSFPLMMYDHTGEHTHASSQHHHHTHTHSSTTAEHVLAAGEEFGAAGMTWDALPHHVGGYHQEGLMHQHGPMPVLS